MKMNFLLTKLFEGLSNVSLAQASVVGLGNYRPENLEVVVQEKSNNLSEFRLYNSFNKFRFNLRLS